jgi:hypothetical protein
MDKLRRFVGIDVAKAAPDVFIGCAGTAFTVVNDEVGIRDLVRQLVPADFVILESDWRYGDARRQCVGGCRGAARARSCGSLAQMRIRQ